MTPEQFEALKKMIAETKAALQEVEAMMADVEACSSEISKKYLYAAIKKQAGGITSHMQSLD